MYITINLALTIGAIMIISLGCIGFLYRMFYRLREHLNWIYTLFRHHEGLYNAFCKELNTRLYKLENAKDVTYLPSKEFFRNKLPEPKKRKKK